jgi:uncharacterized protein (DUF1330 family)
MSKGYWVGLVDVPDLEAYKPYLAANIGPIARFGGRYLIRGGDRQVVEGSARDKVVVIEFESYEKALACYNSPEYQAIGHLRTSTTISDIVIIQGYDGPQPANA